MAVPEHATESSAKTEKSNMVFADPPEAYKYKFYDEEFVHKFDGMGLAYPFYLTLPDVATYEADPSDVAIVTFPKCGTTLMSAIVHMINHNGDPKCMTEGQVVDAYFYFMEMCSPNMPIGVRPIDKMKAATPPRHIVTHLGYDALPKSLLTNSKIIYVTRNPKDTIVSMHNFVRSTPAFGFNGTLEDTFDSFVNNRTIVSPYFDHFANFWKTREQHKNVFFVTFERMLKDFKNVVREIAHFLEKDLSEEQLDNITYHCNFDVMKNNPLTNRNHVAKAGYFDFSISPFMRAGQVGNWKKHFSPELNKRVDEWIVKEEERLKEKLTGFKFEYE